MEELVANLTKIFETLLKDHSKKEECAAYIIETLNKFYNPVENNDKYSMAVAYDPNRVVCNKVYISESNSDDPFFAAVIPVMPTNGADIFTRRNLQEYEVDIDLDYLTMYANTPNCNGITPEVMTAWLMHELVSNVTTDTTFLRYKKLLVKYYDMQNKAIVNAHNNLGFLPWFFVMSNTKKEFIKADSTDAVSNMLKMYGLDGQWNCALQTYVDLVGNSYDFLTDGALERRDRIALNQFNKLARTYISDANYLVNPEYATFARYLCAQVGSELLRAHITKEPQHIAAIKERDVYNVFDSKRLLREAAEIESGEITAGNETYKEDGIGKLYKDMELPELKAKLTELNLDAHNIENASDKLFVEAKMRDFMRALEILIIKDPCNNDALELRETAFKISQFLKTVNSNGVSVVELH